MSINDNKSEQGFLQVDNQILDLLLCDTQLNVYGVLILSKIREYQRKKMQCFVSNVTFSKLYKTSESMIKRQINELYNLGLIESVVSLNTDGVKGKTRILRISKNYSKIMNKILTTKQSLDIIIKGQNGTLPTSFDPRKTSNSLQNQGSKLDKNLDFDPRKNDKIKGQNSPFTSKMNLDIKGQIIGSNHPISSGHSDPITIDINNSLNNKLLEGDTGDLQSPFTSPSPASSTDDNWNATGFEEASIPDVINDANFDLFFNPNDEENLTMENPNKQNTYPNQKYDEMSEWYNTLSPIRRYLYETKYSNAAMNFAWLERMREENQPDYHTPQDIIKYFKESNQLDYLYSINWPNLWMLEMEGNSMEGNSDEENK